MAGSGRPRALGSRPGRDDGGAGLGLVAAGETGRRASAVTPAVSGCATMLATLSDARKIGHAVASVRTPMPSVVSGSISSSAPQPWRQRQRRIAGRCGPGRRTCRGRPPGRTGKRRDDVPDGRGIGEYAVLEHQQHVERPAATTASARGGRVDPGEGVAGDVGREVGGRGRREVVGQHADAGGVRRGAASATTTRANIPHAAATREQAVFMELRISCPAVQVGPFSATNSVAARVARSSHVAKPNGPPRAPYVGFVALETDLATIVANRRRFA